MSIYISVPMVCGGADDEAGYASCSPCRGFVVLNQVELVVHGHENSILRPVAARQPSMRWGRYWIFFSLRLMMRTRLAWSAAAKLAMDRLSSDQVPSTGLRSGAYAGSR